MNNNSKYNKKQLAGLLSILFFLGLGALFWWLLNTKADTGLYYTKLTILFELSIVSLCLCALSCILCLFMLCFYRIRWRLLKFTLILIFFLPVLGMQILSCDVEGNRIIKSQIWREYNLKEHGDWLIKEVAALPEQRLPASDCWKDKFVSSTSKSFDGDFGWTAYNSNLSKLNLDDLPSKTVLLFEAIDGLVDEGNEDVFKKYAQEGYALLYTVDSTIIKYLPKKNEYHVLITDEKVKVLWGFLH